MAALLKRIFSTPLFEDEGKSQQAYLLNMLLWASILLPLPYCLYIIFYSPQSLPRALSHVMAAEAMNFTLLYLLHRGHVQTAAYSQVISFWLFFGFVAANASGIHSPAYLLGYPLVIVISGILLGVRATTVVTALSLAMGGWMVYAENTGMLASRINSSATFWVLSIVIFPLLLILQYVSSNILQTALKRARLSEERYKLILSVSSDYIFETTIDENGNQLTWVGGAFEKLTGYTYEEYVASGGWVAHLHPDDREKDSQDMAALFRNEDLKSEIRTFTKTGELRWVRILARPIWDPRKNRIVKIIGSAQDITEVRITEQAEHEFLRQQASMVQNISDMAWLKDPESRYLAVNEKFAMVSGRRIEEIIGKTDHDLWEESFANTYRQDDLLVLQGQKLKRVEEKQKDHLGNEYWVETIKTPIFNSAGLVIGTTGIARDINERKQAEFLQQRRRELLEKVIELGKIVTEADDLRGTIRKIWQGVHDVLNFDRQAIFLYNFETHRMDDTFGTNNQGEMEDNWHLSFPIGEATTFAKLLERPDGYYFSDNYDQEDNIDESHDMFGVKHFLAVAAWAGDKPVAVICADNLISQRPISEEQLEALRLFAGYAGLAIENSRLHASLQNELTQQKLARERERERRAILEKVVRIGKYVTEVNDLHSTLIRIWEGVHNDLGFDRVAIFLYNPEHNSTDGTFGTNNRGEMIDEWYVSYSMDQGSQESQPFQRVLEKPNTLYLTHNYEQDYNTPAGHIMSGVRDFAAVGAWAGDKPVAFICVDHNITQRPIKDEQIEALRLFAGYAGLAIENARLNSALQNELMLQRTAETRERERRAILEKVIVLGQDVTEANELRTTLAKIWHGLHHDLGFDRAAIFLYNPEHKSMDGTFGTNAQGEMTDEWHVSHSLADTESVEARLFFPVLERPDAIYVTRNFEGEFHIPADHVMAGVKDYASIAAWAGDKPVAFISVDHKITQRPIEDQQLEALRLFAGYIGLAIENANLNNALQNELNQRKLFIEELESKNAELERFTYTVSHDLKSPLVTISGFAGYLEKDARSGNFESLQNNIQRIRMAADKMQRLLKDLLELSRIGHLINTPVDIAFNDIVRDATEILQGQLKEKNLIIQYTPNDLIVKGDFTRLVEVLQNLLENAIKFMGSQPNPKIEINVLRHMNAEPVFYVKDNGIGIATEFHEKIFGLFNKLEVNSSGTGIGLALVKRIIEVHGGRIWVESQPEAGTTFYFTIPQ